MEFFFRDQALALHNYGHKVGVIAPTMRSLRTIGKASSFQQPPAFENDCGILTYRKVLLAALPRIPYGNYWLFLGTAKKLLKRYIADNGKPDILHAHAAVYGGAAGAELSEEFGIPLMLTEHSTGFSRQTYANWQLKLAKKAIESASRCIAVSPSLADLLNARFLGSTSSWKWIPNVVADRFKNQERKVQDNRPVRFLNLALMTGKKGQFDLLEAFKAVQRDGLDSELWLAGDGPIRSELARIVEASGLSKKVCFLGLVEPCKVPELLAQVDVMVVSSHYETFGLVAAEALMAGLPVVATRCGGPECIVKAGDGVLVQPKQPEELANAMLQVGLNLAEYNAHKIATSAKARFAGSAVASQLSAEYESILSSKLFND